MTDILARIDATLAHHERSIYCPCGNLLGPDSRSLDWCSPGCQWAWFNERVTDPHDVYARPDATGFDPVLADVRDPRFTDPVAQLHHDRALSATVTLSMNVSQYQQAVERAVAHMSSQPRYLIWVEA